MKLFGTLKELLSLKFREDNQELTLRGNQATTYTADRDIQIAPGDADQVLVSEDGTQTLTNKTLTAPVVSTISNSGTITVPTGTDTLVARDTTDTLTNKTLTTPVISSISNGGTVTIPTGTLTLAQVVTTTRGDLIRRGVSADERVAAATDNRVVRGDGTDVISGQIDDPDFFTSGAEVTQSAAGVVKSAGQLKGTNTNDSASAGYVGEVISSSLARSLATSLTSGATSNVTSITITAGDWDVRGAVGFLPGGATTYGQVDSAVSKTSATLPAADTLCNPTAGEIWVETNWDGITGNAIDMHHTIPTYRVSVSISTTLYLVADVVFGVSTLSAYGFIEARRAR